MPHLVIPVTLEKRFALSGGSSEGGFLVAKALQLNEPAVTNVYSISAKQFNFSFQEHGVAYGESEASDYKVEVSLPIPETQPSNITMRVDQTPIDVWGLNFAARVIVNHSGKNERIIYIPGTRTYDPAGLTGDAHASERIGPSCSRTQLALTLAQLVASLKGAELEQINSLHKEALPLVERYHGRIVLANWMKMQLEEAIFNDCDVTPYPEYIKALHRAGKFELSEARQHTKEYLQHYNSGVARPPVHYYRKVSKKDKVDNLLSGKDLKEFKTIIG